LRYVDELARMGAHVEVQGQTAIIYGPTSLRGTEVCALDIRAGAAVLLAGLAANGETVIHEARRIERGYADFAANLGVLGAECVVETVEVAPQERL